MATLTQTVVQGGDLIIREWDTLLTREAFLLTMPAGVGATGYNVWGLPIKTITRVGDNHYSCVAVIPGDEANAAGVLIANMKVTIAVAGTGTDRLAGIARGPVVLNKNRLATTGPAGGSYNLDTLASALQAKGIVVRAEPDIVSVGG